MRAAAILNLLLALAGATAVVPPALPSDPIEADWEAIPDDDIMVMMLSGERRVVIRLASRLAPAHVANLRIMARSGYWETGHVYRVEDNRVVQWGDSSEVKALPKDVDPQPPPEFEIPVFEPAQRLPRPDVHATALGITADGWPIATNGKAAWIPHCYASVGAARNDLPDTGNGGVLFAPNGANARGADRGYAVVGWIIEGMENLATLQRGTLPHGMFADKAGWTPIQSVQIAADMPATTRPQFQYRRTDNPRFAALIARMANPPPPVVGSGGVDLCDVPMRVRRTR